MSHSLNFVFTSVMTLVRVIPLMVTPSTTVPQQALNTPQEDSGSSKPNRSLKCVCFFSGTFLVLFGSPTRV